MSADTNAPQGQPKVETEGGVKEMQITVPFPETFVYSNVSALSASFMDIRIGFAEALSDGKAHPRIGIVMPPEHAAHLALNLLQQLAFFERNFGAIRHPAWRDFQLREAAGLKAQADPKKTNLSQP